MKQEIERKFEVKYLPNDFEIEKIIHIQQSVMYRDNNTIIRIRKIKEEQPNNKISYIYTVKTKGDIQENKTNDIAAKYEIETEIEEEYYNELIKRKISNSIDKTRIIIPLHQNLKAEIDVYYGYLKDLLTLEVEFENEEQAERFEKPDWFGEEIGYKELSNWKLSNMTREELKNKVTNEFMNNNNKIIRQLEEKNII